MMQLGIHHIRYSVKDINTFSRLLVNHLGFTPYATRNKVSNSEASSTQVLKHGHVVFIIDQRKEFDDANYSGQFCSGNTLYNADTVCDICLQCCNIPEILHTCIIHHTTIIQPLTKVRKIYFEIFSNVLLVSAIFCSRFLHVYHDTVATFQLALRWMCNSPRTGCARRTTTTYMWHEQAIVEWLRRMISCCLLPQCEALRTCRSVFPIATTPQYVWF